MHAIRFLADLHLHEFSEFSHITENGLNSRLVEQVEGLQYLLSKPNERTGQIPQTLVVLGDWVHKRGYITPGVQWALGQTQAQFGLYDWTVGVPGNHDYPLKAGGPSWLNALLSVPHHGLDRLKFYNEPGVFELPGTTAFLVLVPWMHDLESMREWILRLTESLPAGKGILCTHVAVNGARTDNGFKHEGGLYLSDLKPMHWKATLLGDFHDYQVLDKLNRVSYVGSPYPLTRSDAGKTGGCVDAVIYEDGKLDLFYVINDRAKLIVRTDDMEEAAEQAKAGHFVSFQAKDSEQADSWRAWAGTNCALEFLPTVETKKRLNVTPDSSPREVLYAYMEHADPDIFGGEDAKRDAYSGAMEVIAMDEAEHGRGTEDAMRSLVLENVLAVNFLSYASLCVPLKDRGLVLIEGVNHDDIDAESNGAGKSAVIEAIFYGLFGETLRGISVSDLTKSGEDYCEVRLFARLSDGRELSIRRGRKGSRSILEVLVGRDDITLAEPRSTQQLVNKLTGWTPELFRQAALFGQECARLTDSTDGERKELLESLCSGGSRYDSLYAKSKEMEETASGKASRTSLDISSKQTMLERERMAQGEAARKEAEHEERQKARKEELSGKIASLEKQQTAADRACEDAEQEKADLVEVPEVGLTEHDAESRAVTAATEKHAGLAAEIKAGEAQLFSLQEEMEAFRDLGGDHNCPTCMQAVESGHKAAILEGFGNRIFEANEAIKLKWAEKGLARAELAEAKKALEEKRSDMFVRQHARNVYCIQLREITERLQGLKHHAEGLRQQLASKKEELEKIDSPLAGNSWGEVKAKHEAEAAKLEEDIAERKRALLELQAMAKVFANVSRLFGNQGLRCFVFDSLAPEITARANEALQLLSSGSIQVRMQTERQGKSEKVTLEVLNEHGAPGLKGNSQGQKRKADIALLWAVSSLVSSRINLLCVDEAFDGLDSVAGSRVAALLSQRLDARRTILCITHRPEFKGYFPEIWTATLKNGSSSLVTTKEAQRLEERAEEEAAC